MTQGKKSLAVMAAMAGSLLAVLGAFVSAWFHVRLGIAFLVLGLGVLGALVHFLWTTIRLAASRCGDLQTQADILRTALDASDDGLLVEDADGRAIEWNRPFLDLWGLQEGSLAPGDEGLIQDGILAQIKDAPRYQTRTADHREARETSSFETVERWDGCVYERHSTPCRLADGRPGRIWRFRDVSARARADQFVMRLSAAVEQSPVIIVITDTVGNMEYVNQRFTAVTGYALDEALGQNPRILSSGLTSPKVFEKMWSAITTGSVWTGEFHNRKKNGELFWERATIAPLRDADGVITHYLGLKEDITVQKHLEHQLRHSQKLEAVGLLAGGVAHDLNNILQVINGYSTLMQFSQKPDDPHRESLAEILKAAERAAGLTHSLLAFSRKQVMNPKTLDLNGIVSHMEKFLRRIIGEDVHLKVTLDPEALKVFVDQGQVEQILLNLANNARDDMPRGGTLTLSTSRFRMDEAFIASHGFGQAGPYARLQVTDTGEGMDMATLKRIFDPFFTTRELGRGTGLGLAAVFGIVKQHSGYITADSAEGCGTTFNVYLPTVYSKTALAGEASTPGLPVRGTETILVAEDDPAVRGMLELVLRNYGYKVLPACDGQEAVDLYRANASAIGLILMDIIMPRKGGRQAFEEIRLEHPGVNVLFISGYTADFIKDRGDLDQDMELLMKPVQPVNLLRKVREMLDRRPSPPASGGPQGSLAASEDRSPRPVSQH